MSEGFPSGMARVEAEAERLYQEVRGELARTRPERIARIYRDFGWPEEEASRTLVFVDALLGNDW